MQKAFGSSILFLVKLNVTKQIYKGSGMVVENDIKKLTKSRRVRGGGVRVCVREREHLHSCIIEFDYTYVISIESGSIVRTLSCSTHSHCNKMHSILCGGGCVGSVLYAE